MPKNLQTKVVKAKKGPKPYLSKVKTGKPGKPAKAAKITRSARPTTLAIRQQKIDAIAAQKKYAVLACGLVLQGVPKSQKTPTLKSHFEDLYKHQKKYTDRVKLAGPNYKPADKAKITEALGEINATRFMIATYPKAQLASGFSPGIGIDQIWVERGANKKITKVYIVEAKGPGAGLSTDAAKGPQMGNRWVTNSVIGLKSGTPAEVELKTAMLAALNNQPGAPVLQGLVIATSKDKKSTQPDPLPNTADYPANGIYNGNYQT